MAWKFNNNKPIYLQMIDTLSADIVSGKYKSGDKLPSVRELALEAAVNPNTVQRAFAELENTGLIYTQRNNGRFVTDNEEVIKMLKHNNAREITKDFVKKLEVMGFNKGEALDLISDAFDDINENTDNEAKGE